FIPHAASLGQAFAHCRRFPTAASRRSLGRVSGPVWPSTLSDRLPIVALVGRYPTSQLMRCCPILSQVSPFVDTPCEASTASGISPRFRGLSRAIGQVAHALLTRPPLVCSEFRPTPSLEADPLDLHVLGAPPAFVLSQDQTLRKWYHI